MLAKLYDEDFLGHLLFDTSLRRLRACVVSHASSATHCDPLNVFSQW